MNQPNDKPLPPGRFGLPLVGETLAFAKNAFAFVDDRTGRFGPVWKTHLLGRKAAFVAGPDAAAAFVDPDNCQRAGALPSNVEAIFGGIAVNSLDGEAHANRKRTIMAAFTREALSSYLPALESLVADQLRAWASGGAQPLLAGMQYVAVASIATTILGMEPGPRIEAMVGDYDLVGAGLGAAPIPLPWTAYGKAKKAVARSLAMLEAQVVERRRTPTEDGVSRILAYEDADGARLDDADAARELHHLMAAGFIVFAMLVAMVIRLDERPDVRDKLRAEVDEKAGSGPLTAEQLFDTPYLRQVGLELKRVTPVVPFAIGLAKRTFEVGGYRIPKGWMLGMLIPHTMHEHGVFTDPDRFDPDRFGPGRAEQERHAESLVPQGAGEYFGRGHKCAGVDFSTLLMDIFAVHLLRDYEWELPS